MKAAHAALPALVAAALLLPGLVAEGRERARAQPANLLVLSVDSLRCDRLRPFNPGSGVAVPHIEGLAARGVVLSNAWTTAPWTAPALVSVFTGLYPPSHGVTQRDDTTAPGLPTLPRLLAGHGYRLGNFSFFSAISYFRNLGFPEPEPGLGHDGVVGSFAEWLDGAEPFMAWVHLLEPHLPYGASGYQAREARVSGSAGLEMAQTRAEVPVGSVSFAEGDGERLRQLYDLDLEQLDRVVGELLAALERKGLEKRTLVVLVGDHGEELLDHGWVGHASTALEAKLVPEILRVPLILAGPGLPQGVVSDELVQHVDLLPTLCRLLGLKAPRTCDGDAFRLRRARVRSSRKLAFFDSSLAGNLTPVERRGERLQGVTDGRCLLVQRSGPAGVDVTTAAVYPGDVAVCSERTGRRLRRALEGWQRAQGRQRLRLLRGSAEERPPDAHEVGSWDEAIAVAQPLPDAVLEWSSSGGQIVLEWSGDARAYWVEYSVGRGLGRVTGAFRVEQPGVSFGPFPIGFWGDLAAHSPYRFRVLDPGQRSRSPWVEFTVEAAE